MNNNHLKLVVIQPTSFCNLNCRYCYVPHRKDPAVMNNEVLEASIRHVLESKMFGGRLEFLYHAGEPLTAGIGFYQKAVELINKYKPTNLEVVNSIQTNGLLINDKWCKFFKENKFEIGVSIDGPEFLHDENRRNWSDAASHSKALRGYHLARKNGINVSVLTVLTLNHLSYPDEIFSFYTANTIDKVGFNIEEVENFNTKSTITNESSTLEKYAHFMNRLFDLWWDNTDRIEIREFKQSLNNIYSKIKCDYNTYHDESTDFAIITIHKNGDISTYSPEFAGCHSSEYNDFVIGNVLKIPDLPSLANNEIFIKVKKAIDVGKDNCQKTCKFFELCGSAFLSNRYSETGKLENTESLACTLQKKLLTSIVIKKIQRHG